MGGRKALNLPKNASRGFRSTRCTACQLPIQHCICAHAQNMAAPLHLILLRHPKEAWRSSGTGALLLRCLQGMTIIEPAQWEARQQQGFSEPIAILFPPDGEECLKHPETASTTEPLRPQTLIIPDGSWLEARRMVRKNEFLRNLPRVSPNMSTRWITDPLRIDKWERPCTAEAVGQYLQDLGFAQHAILLRQQLLHFVAAHRKARGLPLANGTSSSDDQPLRPEPSCWEEP